MYKKRNPISLLLLSSLLVMVILDSKTAVTASKYSIDLCIKTVLPSILPFLFLGGAIAAEISGIQILFLEHILHIPKGTAAYFIIGHLCGYPVGAKLIQDAVDRNEIDRSAAARMVALCNNASPAFIIGIISSLFSDVWLAIIIWLIQILSSLLLGMLLPKAPERTLQQSTHQMQSLTKIMTDCIKGAATICGWIVIMGILLAFINKPILNKLSPLGSTILSGAIELTSGLLRMQGIRSEPLRFAVSSVLLSLGGICVILQTKSVAHSVSIKAYLFARMMHAIISCTITTIVALLIFPQELGCQQCIPLLICAGIICCIILFFNKKVVAFEKKL